MAITFFPNGIGGTLGSTLATCKPMQTSGEVWYINSVTGVDAASPAGQNREKPLLTIAQAITNSAAGDILVLMNGSTFTLTGTTLAGGRTLIGEGNTAGVPGATIGFNGGGQLTQAVAGGELRNIRFTGRSATAAGAARVVLSSSNQLVEECYFECGQFDDGAALSITSTLTNHIIRGSTFLSTATSTAAQPLAAIISAGAHTDLVISNCAFDGGPAGFSNYWALDLNAGAVTRLRGTGLSFLRGADYRINASSTGYFNAQLTSGGVRGSW